MFLQVQTFFFFFFLSQHSTSSSSPGHLAVQHHTAETLMQHQKKGKQLGKGYHATCPPPQMLKADMFSSQYQG